jgi:hypothetical protein
MSATKEARKNCRELKNEFKRTTDEAKNKYPESTLDGKREFLVTGYFDLMYVKTKALLTK